MSGQSTQWMRKSSPSSKQGPMKATLPMSSLTRQNSNLMKSSSPTLSPTSAWKTRTSPDPSLSGVRSPGALNYRGEEPDCYYLPKNIDHLKFSYVIKNVCHIYNTRTLFLSHC